MDWKKTFRIKKAQAALEFLTTYGWAFLVILIMIGTLAYFGVLSPSKMLPNRCTFGSEFSCVDYQITYPAAGSGTVTIRMKNNVGTGITLAGNPNLALEGGGSIACTAPAAPTTWNNGDVRDFAYTACTVSGAGAFTKGEKGKVLVSIGYYPVSSGASFTKNVSGEVYTLIG